jgi:cellulose synthase/poly-beta-1,6-N-acetylglucosamine synthase-like glycosyltransferase
MIISILCIIGLVAAFSYLILLLSYTKDWKALKSWKRNPESLPATSVSVVIAARNEAKNIVNCLRSLQNQNYPTSLFEIILVDDFSEDETCKIAEDLKIENLKIIKLFEFLSEANEFKAFKKKAVETGIKNSSNEIILCTDADCILPPDWILNTAAFYEEKSAKFIAAPVVFSQEKSFFERFQALDFLGMMVITGAGINGRYLYMCNGANMAYPRKIFDEVSGFKGVDKVSSGDDMFLLQKISKKYPNDIYFLKSDEVIVETKAMPDLQLFLNQRVRWGSKSDRYNSFSTKIQLGLVWFFMCWIFLLIILAFICDIKILKIIPLLFFIKGIADYFLLSTAVNYFKRENLMKIFIPSVLIHWSYIFIVGLLSLIKYRFRWKGRIN